MELARYGIQPAEIERDPRPSRITALLDAGRVIDARFRLEDTDDTVNAGGVQGEIKETGGPAKKASNIRTELVGFKRRQEELNRRAYPEEHEAHLVAERHAQRQKQMAADFWGSERVTQATALKLRVVFDEQGVSSIVAVESGHGGAGEGTEAQPAGHSDGNGAGGAGGSG